MDTSNSGCYSRANDTTQPRAFCAPGLVGAGGIGMELDTALNLFQWDRVAMVLFAMFVVVIVAEIAVT